MNRRRCKINTQLYQGNVLKYFLKNSSTLSLNRLFCTLMDQKIFNGLYGST